MNPTTENTISDKPAPVDPTVDPFSHIGMVFNSDSSITRPLNYGMLDTPTTFDPTLSPVFTDTVTLNQSKQIWARLYINRKALESNSSTELLPLFVYFHGGGFIVGSPASPVYHDFCSFMAVEVPALIVSVGYRLAPEHRLPAAYYDCVEVLHWIKTSPHEWLSKFGDLSNCYIMGASAGGNIAYHAAAFIGDADLKPLKIKGLILVQPFFGGTKRSESELILANDKVLPLIVNDIMWALSLPLSVDRDHEYSNLTVEIKHSVCDWIRKLGWRVLLKGCTGDPLVDRQKELEKMMIEKGVEVVSSFDEGDSHGIEVLYPSKAKALCLEIKVFISSKLVNI